MRISWLVVAWLVAFTARAGTLGVAPILPQLQTELHLLHAQAQTIFALPVILMGLMAIPGGLLADRFGTRRTVLLGLVLILAGELLRGWAHGFAALAVLTVAFGAGVGIIQPSLPKFAKERFSGYVQTATGIYTSGFATGAFVGAWLTAPFLASAVGGWRGTLVTWGLFSLLPLALWLLLMRGGSGRRRVAPAVPPRPAWRWRSTWLVAALGWSQTVGFYTMSSWMPTYLHELGWSARQISVPYGLFELLAIPGTILAPWFMDRMGRRRPLMTVFGCIYTLSCAGIALLPHQAVLWAICAGTTNSAAFVMSLALPTELAPPEQVASMSGVVLTVAYAGAVLGPPVAGLLRDLSGLPAAGFLPPVVGGIGLILTGLLIPERQPAAGAPLNRGSGAPGRGR